MKVKVTVPGIYVLSKGGKEELFVDGETVLDVLRNAAVEHEKLLGKLLTDAASLSGQVNVFVNDVAVDTHESLKARLREGDVISILLSDSGGKEMKRRIYLNIPKDIVGEPLLFQVGHEFKVVPNIRGASISDDIGLVALELTGEEQELDRAIEWLTKKGIQIEQIAEPEVQNQENVL